ncbi:uncharacterized protein LOC116923034 isoform X1 [Daphnia magna]|uniref:uncharacterized protein LOC116923034 isoform X1 n=1 Tax=Daphnia magna TaxID=35525 RepID=UPI0014041016|nr:uncharacterized protein LOC116923034 isoform X1 [Daphnia magna]
MSDQKEIYQLLQLLRKERQNQSEKARLAKRLSALRDENLRLLTEIGHCRNNVENLRKLLANDDQKAYHHYIHQRNTFYLILIFGISPWGSQTKREKMLHQRQQLREKKADQRKLVDELDQRFERLQLATFPVFS